MSDIRKEFYESINKANSEKPKKAPRKERVVEKVSIEEQIRMILNESQLAASKIEVVVNNEPLIDYLYGMTKKSDEQLAVEKKINEEVEKINKLREEARKKWNLLNKKNEAVNFTPSSSSSAAGGGRISISVDTTSNSYVVDDYVENYLL